MLKTVQQIKSSLLDCGRWFQKVKAPTVKTKSPSFAVAAGHGEKPSEWLSGWVVEDNQYLERKQAWGGTEGWFLSITLQLHFEPKIIDLE